MARHFDQRVLDEVSSANDIVEVISSYIKVKNDGKNYSALCPFHREKTPSFKIFPDSQRYKCFGCGEGGNVFMFVSKIERLTFPEAVEQLAKRGGITLETTEAQGTSKNERELCHRLNRVAQEYFAKSLKSAAGKIAREYLTGRGISLETAESFGLGYSPDDWQGLIDYAAKKEISDTDLVAAGLCVLKERGKLYDRFRNRLMFPIVDAQRRIAGFGARTLGDDLPKYLNSPETPAFNKSNLLFGISRAKDAISTSEQAVLMEGYTDVIAASEAGFRNCVATLGTALTASHLRFLKRYANEVVLVYDGDKAGVKAAERSLPIFIAEEVEGKVVALPDEMDPFDFISAHGADAFRSEIEKARPLFEFFVAFLKRSYDLTDPLKRFEAAERLSTIIAQVADPMKKEIWLANAADFLEINPAVLRGSVKSKNATRNFRDRLKGDSGTEIARPEKLGSDEWRIIGVCLSFPQLVDEYLEKISKIPFESSKAQGILNKILSFPRQDDWISAYWKTIGDSEEFSFAEQAVTNAPDTEVNARAMLESSFARYEIDALKQRIEEIKRSIAHAGNEGDDWATEFYMDELLTVLMQMKRKRDESDPAKIHAGRSIDSMKKRDFGAWRKSKGLDQDVLKNPTE